MDSELLEYTHTQTIRVVRFYSCRCMFLLVTNKMTWSDRLSIGPMLSLEVRVKDLSRTIKPQIPCSCWRICNSSNSGTLNSCVCRGSTHISVAPLPVSESVNLDGPQAARGSAFEAQGFARAPRQFVFEPPRPRSASSIAVPHLELAYFLIQSLT